jgi:hypothetical protein
MQHSVQYERETIANGETLGGITKYGGIIGQSVQLLCSTTVVIDIKYHLGPTPESFEISMREHVLSKLFMSGENKDF